MKEMLGQVAAGRLMVHGIRMDQDYTGVNFRLIEG